MYKLYCKQTVDESITYYFNMWYSCSMKIKIFVKPTKKGQWMCYSNFSYYHPIRPTKEEAVEHFRQNLHLRNYEVVELTNIKK